TTSNAVHAAVPASTSSIGRGPRFRPPASGAPSTTSAWPLSVSATKVTPSVHLIRVFTPPPCTQSQHLLTDFETVEPTKHQPGPTPPDCCMLRCNMRALNHPCGPETSTSPPQVIPPSSSYGGMFTRPQGRVFLDPFLQCGKSAALSISSRLCLTPSAGPYYHPRLCKMWGGEVQAPLRRTFPGFFIRISSK